MGVYRLEHPEELRSYLVNGRRFFEVRPGEGSAWHWQQAADTWEAIALDFLGTGDCASLCPRCACFTVDMQPVGDGQSSIGEQGWDSCLSADIQSEAQGHNPSSSSGQRTKHIWLHKFGNAFKKRYGSCGCVGCGRCERAPRKDIGSKEALRRVARP
ncbi:4Fe-4S dicluster domain-containing protein [Pseudomonas sp. OTU5201]|uniref:4Fe-4S dicluster domain-containing protein n=1 Tax=Pseudomonas sp. OTU5201 TaxID=3043850 RepID=UPI00406CF142